MAKSRKTSRKMKDLPARKSESVRGGMKAKHPPFKNPVSNLKTRAPA